MIAPTRNIRALPHCLCLPLLVVVITTSHSNSLLPTTEGFSFPLAKLDFRQPTRLSAQQSNNNSFDVSKPAWDWLSLRQVRGDALAKYNSLNQSEPLRINLSALASFTLLVLPSLVSGDNSVNSINELVASSSDAAGESQLTGTQTALSLIGSVISALFFLRECRNRSKQLTRLEKELNALDLPIRIPANAIADQRYQKPTTIAQLQSTSAGSRILAITGSPQQLDDVFQQLSVLGRRLVQASTYVVLVPRQGGNSGYTSITPKKYYPWLADVSDPLVWLSYFHTLLGDSKNNSIDEDNTFGWFGLSSSGRSFGSGRDETAVSWLQLMGQHLRPTNILDEDDPSENHELISKQHLFYQALTEGRLEEMKELFSDSYDDAVSEVLVQGGRLDSWNTCLKDGNRPEGMKVADGDVCVISESEVWTTAIEFPALIEGATLLAVQKWKLQDKTWKLEKHQTIPWAQQRAAGTLICDCRGCVSLTRGPERRTFGGLIG